MGRKTFYCVIVSRFKLTFISNFLSHFVLQLCDPCVNMSKIDLIYSCNVGMATPTIINNEEAIANSRVELTPWDLQLLLAGPIQKGILFYKPDEKSQEFEKTFIDHLKDSLSRTLDFFPPLTGRLRTIKNEDNMTCFFVDCNNEGAEFIHAIAHGVSVSDILDPKYIPGIVSSFFPLNGVSNYEGISKPLLGVQVTELVDGLFIGCTANHSVVDGPSFWHFFNSWSEMSRGFDKISKSPVLKRWFPSNIFANNNHLIPTPPFEKKRLLNNLVPPPPLLERAFHFSKESVAKLKAKANLEAGIDRISSFQALLSHICRSVIRSRRLQSVHNTQSIKDTYFILAVGMRARIPLQDDYFGNAFHIARIEMKEQDFLGHELGWTASKLHQLVAQQTREKAIDFVKDWVNNPIILTSITDACQKSSHTFMISSSPRFDVYGNDFGWGKPVGVRSGMAHKSDGKFTFYPAVEPGGIDVEVCLAPQTLHAMDDDDAEFMEAVII